ncbi:MAG: histidine kinase [Bacteroidia bacterium]|nr:histidine kinase [Bacteroidia bacterium]
MIETGNKQFWIYQSLGWGTIGLSNFVVQLIGGFPWDYLLGNAILPFIFGLAITSIYRKLIKDMDWQKWKIRQLLLLIVGSTLLLTTLFLASVVFASYIIYPTPGINLPSLFSNFFIFTIIMGLWNLIYFLIHYFNNWNRAEIEKWKLAAEMKDAQLGSLKSQINPHFVFNALNNIRALILEDPDKARDMLLNFSDLFRYSLKHTDQAKVDLEEELEIVNQYLELLSIQYEDKLQYELSVSQGLGEIKIPPMILQLLVENAVKHGISQNKAGGEIRIDISRSPQNMDIEVKNSGSLKKSAKLGEKLGVGLENISRRLELIYNGKAKFDMYEEKDFVVARLNIPLV